jgi:hypothetical protein
MVVRGIYVVRRRLQSRHPAIPNRAHKQVASWAMIGPSGLRLTTPFAESRSAWLPEAHERPVYLHSLAGGCSGPPGNSCAPAFRNGCLAASKGRAYKVGGQGKQVISPYRTRLESGVEMASGAHDLSSCEPLPLVLLRSSPVLYSPGKIGLAWGPVELCGRRFASPGPGQGRGESGPLPPLFPRPVKGIGESLLKPARSSPGCL